MVAVTGPQTIDLDGGWQFARVPTPPSIWNGPDAVPAANWRVIKVSSQETNGEDAPASKALDGRPETFWHTEWQAKSAPYPHRIQIDLGGLTDVAGIRILPRQTGPQNGRPRHFRMELSREKEFARPFEITGEIPNSGSLFERRFSPARGRYLAITFEDGYRPEPFLAIAEIGLIRAMDQGIDWASQYNIANVTTGDARFDPSATDLEKRRQTETRKLSAWQPATLPHAAWIRPLGTPEIWQGVAYYHRRIPAPPPGRRATLEIQGMQSVDAWLSGRPIGHRRGGYLPLRAEIHGGGDLLVRVDNTDNPLIPPGKPQGQLDFMYGAGLVGHARLILTDPLAITDPLETDGGVRVEEPRLSKNWASTWVYTGVRNNGSRPRTFVVKQTIFDPNGRRVAVKTIDDILLPGKTEKIAQSLSIPHPQLWSTDSPKLYRLVTTIEERGSVIDRVETRIGLRTIEVSRAKGFLLNGQPLRLVGTNRHQDYPWVGPALSDAAQRRDALMIKRSGHNIVRLSHYNQSPVFMDACDDLGILTIPCIPGWQFVNSDPRFRERVLRDIRESIRRDRNHPSVAWWEASLNETYPAASLAKSWYDTAKAEHAGLVAGDETPGAPWDVIYNGWREDLSRPQDTAKPGYIREYGDYEFGGGNSSSRVKMGDGMDLLLGETWNHVWSYNKFRPQYPWTMGAGTWEMFDHNVPWAFAVSASGLADLMRREKPSFWFFASQMARKPYLRVTPLNPSPLRGRGAGVRGESLSVSASVSVPWGVDADTSERLSAPHPRPLSPREERGDRSIIAFTNAPRATLYVNGRAVQTLEAIPGPETKYGLDNRFDGSNTAHLSHPPIVFRNVPAGEIKVVGSNGVADHLHLAGKPVRLKLWVDDLGVPVRRNDLVFLRAAIVDAKGTICSDASLRIMFSGAPFAGESSTLCEMGVASVLIRTPLNAAKFSLRAAAGALKGATSLSIR